MTINSKLSDQLILYALVLFSVILSIQKKYIYLIIMILRNLKLCSNQLLRTIIIYLLELQK